ncbi:MAG: flagellar transcriptional regulator FlhC [Pseudomonadota bacterium]|jgi:flagellar transcriptional activator FlhC
MSTPKSVLRDSAQVQRAVALIGLGARLQVLESVTDLSYERLLRLYKEVAGRSPSKGQLPFSTDWFLGWQANIHASLFHNIYRYVSKASALDDIDAIMKAWRLYAEQAAASGLEPLLSITRAWRLVQFMDSQMLTSTPCRSCGGHFVTDLSAHPRHFTCGLCEPPSRAGKGSAAGALTLH